MCFVLELNLCYVTKLNRISRKEGLLLRVIYYALFLIFCLLFLTRAFAIEIKVSTTQELRQAIHTTNQTVDEEPIEILLADGHYNNATNLRITRPWLTIRSLSGQAKKVVLSGNGMRESNSVELIFDVSASHVTIADLTLKEVSNHLIQVRAEANADYFTLSNCVLQDAYQQLLKVSGSNSNEFADFGIIEHNRFEYTAGIGPNYYIGGIDAHRSRNWTVSHNTFSNISSPQDRVAEYAIHFWHGAENIEVIHNLIVNSDRGIGFGMGNRGEQARGGLIAHNRIVHTESPPPFADVGISLESSPDTIVSKNVINMKSSYPHAIEYRFLRTQNVVIEGNISNKAIAARDGGTALLINNQSAGFIQQYWNSLHYFVRQKLRKH
jgi:hypothetical protein